MIQQNFIVQGDYLYPIAMDGLWRIQLSTGEAIHLTTDETLFINVRDGWLYYLNCDKEEGSPYVSVTYLAKMRKDVSGFERLFEYHE